MGSKNTPRTALVIGCGIGGPVAAMALQKGGIDATVFEAYERSSEFAGSFLNLASNGLDALKTLSGLNLKPILASTEAIQREMKKRPCGTCWRVPRWPKESGPPCTSAWRTSAESPSDHRCDKCCTDCGRSSRRYCGRACFPLERRHMPPR